MATTLLLDRTRWDLLLDKQGNIAVATEIYSTVQDVASAARLFRGELWFDTTKGVPYWEDILGHAPPLGIVKAELQAAALSVPLVVSAAVFVRTDHTRTMTGQIQVTSTLPGVLGLVTVPLSGGRFTIGLSRVEGSNPL